MADGKLTGRLAGDSGLRGAVAGQGEMTGRLAVPPAVGVSDYDRLRNKPAINNHELRGGNNTLEEMGIVDDEFSILDVIGIWNDN